MKRFFIAVTTLVLAPIATAAGCNAILGNAPGLLESDASLAESGSGCGQGTKSCQGVCVDITKANNGCSGDCTACPTPKNAQSACNLQSGSFVCGVGQCNTGFGDCNSSPTDGCESPLTSKTSCGSCDENCVDAGFAFCSPGTGCSNTCNGIDCCGNAPCASQSDPSGECVDTTNNPKNCGGCGVDCTALPGAAQAECDNSVCKVTSCVGGQALCNGSCVSETNRTCGDNCTDCTALSQVCVGGACQACSGSTFCGTACCAQNCCGTGPTAVCQVTPCGCAGSQFPCGTSCCASGTQVCCNGTQCTNEGNNACGPNCDICDTTFNSFCDTSVGHKCICGGGTNDCRTTGSPATHWCCPSGDTCGTSVGDCIGGTSCTGPGQCDRGGGNCGCGGVANCFPPTASPNCGTCGTSCTAMFGTCCCPGGGPDGGYFCQGGHMVNEAGVTNCTGCNP